MADSPEKIATGVYRVDGIGIPNAINVLLLENDDGWTLVDTGVASSAGRIRDALSSLGSGPEDLRRIFITHHHSDHIGGLRGVLEWAPQVDVGASGREAEAVSGVRGPDPQSNPLLRYMARNAEVPGAPVGRVLNEGDYVSGFRVISTPGHTLGHVSLLRDEDGLLFTADAFGQFPGFRMKVGVMKAFCSDPALAKRSAEKLLGENFSTALFAHGDALRTDAKERLREVIDRCRY